MSEIETEETEMECFEVEYWQNMRFWVRVEAESEEEALDAVECWDTTKVDFDDATPTDADCPENVRLL